MTLRYSKDNRQILEEASAWFVEFRLGHIDKIKRRDFMRWLKCSPEHVRAYMEISGAYAKLPSAAVVGHADIAQLIERTRARSNVVPLDNVDELHMAAVPLNPARKQHASRTTVARLAASIALFGLGVVVAAWVVLTQAPTYATQTAEHRSITLDDGSKVDLNARTRIRVSFTRAERSIELLEGQALFHVSRDLLRPFIVSGAGTRIRAVGTRFDVNLRRSGTTVTVLEGRVAILDKTAQAGAAPKTETNGQTHGVPGSSGTVAAGSGSAFILAAGEQAIITPKAIARPPHANIAAATAWTEGEFEFDETPLADVVEEFNRYNRLPIVIESQGLMEFRISGNYSSEDPHSLIRFLENQPDLIVTESASEFRIRQR